MNQACDLCGGLCCAGLMLMLPQSADELMQTRGAITIAKGVTTAAYLIPAPCIHHMQCGKCGIWDRRPQFCRDYEVGSPECRATVKALHEEPDTVLNLMPAPTPATPPAGRVCGPDGPERASSDQNAS